MENLTNIKDFRIKIPINLFTLRPCKEYLLLKLRFKGLYVDFQLICNELLYIGLTNEELAESVTKIIELQEREYSNDKVIKIIYRYVKAKRT